MELTIDDTVLHVVSSTEALEEQYGLTVFVVCPLCGIHRKLHKNGLYAIRRKKARQIESRARIYNPDKETRFDVVNIEDEPFFSIRLSTGRAEGLVEVFGVPLKDALKYPALREETIRLLREMKKQLDNLSSKVDELLKEYT